MLTLMECWLLVVKLISVAIFVSNVALAFATYRIVLTKQSILSINEISIVLWIDHRDVCYLMPCNVVGDYKRGQCYTKVSAVINLLAFLFMGGVVTLVLYLLYVKYKWGL